MRSITLLACAIALLTACASAPPDHTRTPPASKPASDQGIAGLTARTPMTLSAISAALGSDYRLLDGMETHDGSPSAYIEARKNGKLALQIHSRDQKISRIDLYDPGITLANGVKIGTPFSRLYQQAFNACQRSPDLTPGILCQAPDNPHLIYQFTGSSPGTSPLIPDNNTLQHWTISKIIWQSDSSE